jgi:UDP:flavonoid glycosyltransferase YjiC (YdhE family)
VPVYAVGVAPLMFNSRDAPPNFFGLKPARTPVGRVRDRVVDALLRSTMKQGVARFNELLVAEGLTPLGSPRDFFDLPARASRRFFQSGVPGFEYPRSDLPENVRFVGALLPHQRASAEPLPHEDRLRSSHSVVVVSQGTVDNRDPEKLIAPTLEALAGTDHLVVATTGGRNTAELRRRFPAENLLVEDWIDFNRLMPHASLFICNGGFGSIMLAFGNGLPVLSAGKREGKNDVNARIDHFGLGIDLRTEQPTAKQIARGVERILRDDGYAQRVARLRAELQTYDPFERIAHEIAASGGVITSPPGPPR